MPMDESRKMEGKQVMSLTEQPRRAPKATPTRQSQEQPGKKMQREREEQPGAGSRAHSQDPNTALLFSRARPWDHGGERKSLDLYKRVQIHTKSSYCEDMTRTEVVNCKADDDTSVGTPVPGGREGRRRAQKAGGRSSGRRVEGKGVKDSSTKA